MRRKRRFLTSPRAGDSFVSVGAMTKSLVQQFEQRRHHQGDVTGLSTGFVDLDRLTSGLQPSDLTILASRPAMGKTSCAMQIATHVALSQRVPVAVFSLEMSKEQLMERLVASHAGVNSTDLRRGNLNEAEWDKTAASMRHLRNVPLLIDDSPNITTLEMRAKLRRLATEHGELGLVVVDYLQLAHTQRKNENRVQEVSEIARNLKAMAREFKVPLIALSQLSRSVEQRDDKRPMLSDLRESGGIEAEADLVTFIYRPSYYHREGNIGKRRWQSDDEATVDEGETEIIVGKHRNGPVGTVRLRFQAEYTRFVNYAP